MFSWAGRSARAESLIYIEPGHGMNSGAYSSPGGYYEDQVNLAIGLALRDLLVARGYPVYMARTDNSVNLSGSAEDVDMDRANAMGAAVFLSIHNNSSVAPSAGGTETWYYPKTAADILFANLIHSNMLQAIRGYGYNTDDRGIKIAPDSPPDGPWMICRGNMPSVLVETLFVSNPTEAQILIDPAYQRAVAQGFCNAITAMVAPPDSPSPPPANPPSIKVGESFPILYNYGGATSRLWTIGRCTETETKVWPFMGWFSQTGGFDANRSRIARGDFDGDGNIDVASLYDYGNSTSGLWFFLNNQGNGNLTPVFVWQSSPGGFDTGRAKITAGNFDGDAGGKSDIAILYDYGGSTSMLWTLVWNGSTSSPACAAKMVWFSGNGGFDANRAKIVSGDFGGDTKDDAAVLYNYGGGTSRIWTFTNNGTTMTPAIAWYSGEGGFDANRAKITSGDFGGDTKADIAILYDYGGATSRIWTFINGGATMTPNVTWFSGNGGFDANRAKLTEGDFGGDTKADAAVLYDYGNATSRIWAFITNGAVMTPKMAWYGGRGGFDKNLAKMEGDPSITSSPAATRPIIVSPMNGETVGPQITLRWTAVSGAVGYDIEILDAPPEIGEVDGTAGSVHRIAVIASTTTSATYNTNSLSEGNRYYYRVIARDSSNFITKYSLADSFTTNIADSAGHGFPILYNYGGSTSRIWTMVTRGGAAPTLISTMAWESGPGGFEANQAKITGGDFDGDGTLDSAVLYDYGNANARLWLFLNNQGTGTMTPVMAWYGGPSGFDASRAKMTSGDFDGDGKTDVAMLYDYGGGTSRLLIFKSDGVSFTWSEAWYSGNGGFDMNRAKITAGDYDNDGKDEVGALYDYGDSNSRIWIFDRQDNGAFTPIQGWFSAGFDANRAKITSGDCDGDGKADISALYDYGGSTSRLWIFKSDGASFTPNMAWYSGSGGFDAERAKIASGDFDNNGKSDVALLYDYGNATTRVWTMISAGLTFTPNVAWYGGEGGFDANRAKMEGDPSVSLNFHTITVAASGAFNVCASNGSVLMSLQSGETASVGYYYGNYYLYSSTGQSLVTQSYIRMVPVGGSILRVNDMSPYNMYRGILEIRYSFQSNRLWVINELDMNSYMNGMGEEPETWPGGANEPTGTAGQYQEFLKLSAVAFRSYAYDVVAKKNKHAGEPFDLCNDPSSCQWYIGYSREIQGGNLAAAVSATSGQVATYGGTPIRIPYFSDCDGRTRSALEVWGSSSYPWCAGVSDAPYCNGHTLRGHGVGICMNGARWRAAAGADYSSILHYYLVIDQALGNIGNPTVRVGIFSVGP